MKSMRALALASVVGLGIALPACGSDAGGGGPSGAGQTLTVLMGANTVFPNEQRQWFADVSTQFEKQTGAKVQFETFASPNDELTKIQTSVLSGQGLVMDALGTTFIDPLVNFGGEPCNGTSCHADASWKAAKRLPPKQ